MRRVVLSFCFILFFSAVASALLSGSGGKAVYPAESWSSDSGAKKASSPSILPPKVLTDREIADYFIGHIKTMQTQIWDLMAESYKISLSVYANASEDERAEMRKKRVSLFTAASSIISGGGHGAVRENVGHHFKSQPDQARVNKAFAEFSRAVEALDYRLRDLQVGYTAIDARPPWEGDPDDVCECEEDEDAPCDPGEPCGTDGGISPQNDVLPPQGETPRLQISPAKDI